MITYVYSCMNRFIQFVYIYTFDFCISIYTQQNMKNKLFKINNRPSGVGDVTPQPLVSNIPPIPPIAPNQIIPKIIHQTHESEYLSINNYTASEINSQINSDYSYKFYNKYDRQQYISTHFGRDSRTFEAYNKLIPNTYKSDLFRWCVLYIEGGVYLDCKSTFLIPLRNFLPNQQMCLFRDPIPGIISTGFIASVPRHNIAKTMIDRIVDNVMNRNYGSDPLDVTGPRLLTKVINELCENTNSVTIIGKRTIFVDYYYDSNYRPLIQRYYDGFWNVQTLIDRYEFKWVLGNVFSS